MQTIYLDISNKGVVPTIYAKQGDVGRKVQVIFMDSGIPYEIPENAGLSVWYDGDSGDGNYTDIGNKSAIVVENNKVTFELITQMLNNDGEGIVCLIMNVGEEQIGSWNIRYLCEKVPGFESEGAKEYYTAFSKAVENLSYPDTSLSVSGKAADSRAVGDALKNKLSTDGTIPMTDNLPMGGHKVTGLGTPTADGDAVPLGYANQNFAPASHAEDKNNPHGVTAAQVGARPNTWVPSLSDIGALGFKKTLTSADDLNNITEDGVYVYSTNSRPANCPYSNAGVILVFGANSSASQKIQFCFRYGEAGCGKFRCLLSGSWLAWADFGGLVEDGNNPGCYYIDVNGNKEWVNPAMNPGVEYRTTERFEGEPVYCMLVKYTNASTIGSDSSLTSFEIPHGNSGINKLIRITGRQSGVYPVPGVTTKGGTYGVGRITSQYITLRMNNCSFDSRTWCFNIYYTK